MGLSKFKDGSPQYWKEKYFKLLERQEQFEKEQTATQESLRKALIGLSAAANGFHRSLDPHLDRIRDLFKANIQNQRLRKELEVFSNAVTAFNGQCASGPVDASLLFTFLEKHYPDRVSVLKDIQEQYLKQSLADDQSLFQALADAVDDQSVEKNDLTTEHGLSDCQVIIQDMIQLLDSVDLPGQFVEEAKQLKTRLLSGHALGPVFDDAVSLLLAIKKHMQAEQQEMADFLSTLTEALADLGVKASGVNTANDDAQKKRDCLDKDVAEQMADLQRKSASATQLEPLKQLINIRLQRISEQIQEHNSNEQAERDKRHQELKSLMLKIREMELESIELKVRLAAAQRRAARDSLTGLPNRQALEERLAEEIARAKRYDTPLSVAVWDIDYFKNINDTFGHRSGDKALVIIAKLLSRYCRETDFVARFGGEEFVTLLPETEVSRALSVVDKLRKIVGECGFRANGATVSITISCGLTQYVQGDTSDSIFVRADGAMYQAKQGGRNQCVVV